MRWRLHRLPRPPQRTSTLPTAAHPPAGLQSGRITSVAACQDSQSIASGSAAGSIHVWRVEYAGRAGGAPERYTGIVSTRQVGAVQGSWREAGQRVRRIRLPLV